MPSLWLCLACPSGDFIQTGSLGVFFYLGFPFLSPSFSSVFHLLNILYDTQYKGNSGLSVILNTNGQPQEVAVGLLIFLLHTGQYISFISSSLKGFHSFWAWVFLILFLQVLYTFSWASQVALVVKNPYANAGDLRDMCSIPGLERSPGRGNSNPLQYSWLENPMDRGAQQATVHSVTESRAQLKWLGMHTYSELLIFSYRSKKSEQNRELLAQLPSFVEKNKEGPHLNFVLDIHSHPESSFPA